MSSHAAFRLAPAPLLLAAGLLLMAGCGPGPLVGSLFGVTESRGGGGGGEPAPVASAVSVETVTDPVLGTTRAEGAVEASFTLATSSGRAVPVAVFFSTDGGASFAPATIEGGALPPQAPGPISLRWDSAADEIGLAAPVTAVLRVVPENGVGADSPPFRVDNTPAPRVAAIDLPDRPSPTATDYASPLTVLYRLAPLPAGSAPVSLHLRYSTDGGDLFHEATVDGASATSGVDPTDGGLRSLVWAAARDGIVAETSVILELVAATTKSDLSGAARTHPFRVNCTPVFATASVPATSEEKPAYDRVPLEVVLFDASADPADLVVEYTADDGASFQPATEAPRAPSEGRTSLSTSPSGAAHRFVWNSYEDLRTFPGRNDAFLGTVALRVTPIDRATGVRGDPVLTRPFVLDNRRVATVIGGGMGRDLDPWRLSFLGAVGIAVSPQGEIAFADVTGAVFRIDPASGRARYGLGAVAPLSILPALGGPAPFVPMPAIAAIVGFDAQSALHIFAAVTTKAGGTAMFVRIDPVTDLMTDEMWEFRPINQEFAGGEFYADGDLVRLDGPSGPILFTPGYARVDSSGRLLVFVDIDYSQTGGPEAVWSILRIDPRDLSLTVIDLDGTPPHPLPEEARLPNNLTGRPLAALAPGEVAILPDFRGTGGSEPHGLIALNLGSTPQVFFPSRPLGAITVMPESAAMLLAGGGTTPAEEGADGLSAALGQVSSPAFAPDGTIYFLEQVVGEGRAGARVWRIDPLDGTLSLVAGAGLLRPEEPVQGTEMAISPGALAAGPGDALYVADKRMNRIFRMEPGTGLVSPVAGSGLFGTAGDGGDALGANLSVSLGTGIVEAILGATDFVKLAADEDDDLFILEGGRVRFVNRGRAARVFEAGDEYDQTSGYDLGGLSGRFVLSLAPGEARLYRTDGTSVAEVSPAEGERASLTLAMISGATPENVDEDGRLHGFLRVEPPQDSDSSATASIELRDGDGVLVASGDDSVPATGGEVSLKPVGESGITATFRLVPAATGEFTFEIQPVMLLASGAISPDAPTGTAVILSGGGTGASLALDVAAAEIREDKVIYLTAVPRGKIATVAGRSFAETGVAAGGTGDGGPAIEAPLDCLKAGFLFMGISQEGEIAVEDGFLYVAEPSWGTVRAVDLGARPVSRAFFDGGRISSVSLRGTAPGNTIGGWLALLIDPSGQSFDLTLLSGPGAIAATGTADASIAGPQVVTLSGETVSGSIEIMLGGYQRGPPIFIATWKPGDIVTIVGSTSLPPEALPPDAAVTTPVAADALALRDGILLLGPVEGEGDAAKTPTPFAVAVGPGAVVLPGAGAVTLEPGHLRRLDVLRLAPFANSIAIDAGHNVYCTPGNPDEPFFLTYRIAAESGEVEFAAGLPYDRLMEIVQLIGENVEVKTVMDIAAVLTAAGLGDLLQSGRLPDDTMMVPWGIATDSRGDLFLSDPFGNGVRRVSEAVPRVPLDLPLETGENGGDGGGGGGGGGGPSTGGGT